MREPPKVTESKALAARLGFERSCEDGGGELLHVLAGRRGVVRAGDDDFTAGWAEPDPRREAWLGHPRHAAVELGTSPAADPGRVAIVATVRR